MDAPYQRLCKTGKNPKPPGILSTDEPGGMPDLIRAELGDVNATVCTVHRLDQVVGGLMVFARTRRAAGDLSRQMQSVNLGRNISQ